eukprot:scpid9402/ scgid15459/ 
MERRSPVSGFLPILLLCLLLIAISCANENEQEASLSRSKRQTSLVWPSQQYAAPLHCYNALMLRLPAVSPTGAADSFLVVEYRMASPPGPWQVRTTPFSTRFFRLDGLQAFTAYDVRFAERTLQQQQSAYSNTLQLTTNQPQQYCWREDSWVESKTTANSITVQLHPVGQPIVNTTVQGLFLQYYFDRNGDGDITRDERNNDGYQRAPYASEHEIIGLRPDTQYRLNAPVYFNPPQSPVQTLGLFVRTLAPDSPVWRKPAYNVSSLSPTGVDIFVPTMPVHFPRYVIDQRYLQSDGTWTAWSRLGGLSLRGSVRSLTSLIPDRRYQVRARGFISVSNMSAWGAPLTIQPRTDRTLVWRWDSLRINEMDPTALSFYFPRALLPPSIRNDVITYSVDYRRVVITARRVRLGGRSILFYRHDASAWQTITVPSEPDWFTVPDAISAATYDVRAIGLDALGEPVTELSAVFRTAPAPTWGSNPVDFLRKTQTRAVLRLPAFSSTDATRMLVRYRPVSGAGDGDWAIISIDAPGQPELLLANLTGDTEYEVTAQFLVGEKPLSLPSSALKFSTLSNAVPAFPDQAAADYLNGPSRVGLVVPGTSEQDVSIRYRYKPQDSDTPYSTWQVITIRSEQTQAEVSTVVITSLPASSDVQAQLINRTDSGETLEGGSVQRQTSAAGTPVWPRPPVSNLTTTSAVLNLPTLPGATLPYLEYRFANADNNYEGQAWQRREIQDGRRQATLDNLRPGSIVQARAQYRIQTGLSAFSPPLTFVVPFPTSFTIQAFGGGPSTMYRVTAAKLGTGEGGSSAWNLLSTTDLQGSEFPHTITGLSRGFHSFRVDEISTVEPCTRTTIFTLQSSNGYQGTTVVPDWQTAARPIISSVGVTFGVSRANVSAPVLPVQPTVDQLYVMEYRAATGNADWIRLRVSSSPVPIPEDLADGVYEVRFGLTNADGSTSSFNYAHQFCVQSRVLSPIIPGDFIQHSYILSCFSRITATLPTFATDAERQALSGWILSWGNVGRSNRIARAPIAATSVLLAPFVGDGQYEVSYFGTLVGGDRVRFSNPIPFEVRGLGSMVVAFNQRDSTVPEYTLRVYAFDPSRNDFDVFFQQGGLAAGDFPYTVYNTTCGHYVSTVDARDSSGGVRTVFTLFLSQSVSVAPTLLQYPGNMVQVMLGTVQINLPQLTAEQLAMYNRFILRYRRLGSGPWQEEQLSSAATTHQLSLTGGVYQLQLRAEGSNGDSIANVPVTFTVPSSANIQVGAPSGQVLDPTHSYTIYLYRYDAASGSFVQNEVSEQLNAADFPYGFTGVGGGYYVATVLATEPDGDQSTRSAQFFALQAADAPDILPQSRIRVLSAGPGVGQVRVDFPALSSAQRAQFSSFAVRIRPFGGRNWTTHQYSSSLASTTLPGTYPDGNYELLVDALGGDQKLSGIPSVFPLRGFGDYEIRAPGGPAAPQYIITLYRYDPSSMDFVSQQRVPGLTGTSFPYSIGNVGAGSYGTSVVAASPAGLLSSRSSEYTTFGNAGTAPLLQYGSQLITAQAVRPGQSQITVNLPALSASQRAEYGTFEISFRRVGDTWRTSRTSTSSSTYVIPGTYSDGSYEVKVAALSNSGQPSLVNIPFTFPLQAVGNMVVNAPAGPPVPGAEYIITVYRYDASTRDFMPVQDIRSLTANSFPYSISGIGSGSYAVTIGTVVNGAWSSRSVAYNTYGGGDPAQVLTYPAQLITSSALVPGWSTAQINLPQLSASQRAEFSNFEVYYRRIGDANWIVGRAGLESDNYLISGVLADGDYEAKVRLVSRNGQSALSNIPVRFTLTALGNIDVPAPTGTLPGSQYTVTLYQYDTTQMQYTQLREIANLNESSFPYSLSGIGSGSYAVAVSSMSATGASSTRSISYNTYGGAASPDILQLPSNLITTQTVRPGESRVRINLPTLTPSQQATYSNFEIRFRDIGSPQWQSGRTASSSNAYFILRTLTDGNYEVQVQAVANDGRRLASVPVGMPLQGIGSVLVNRPGGDLSPEYIITVYRYDAGSMEFVHQREISALTGDSFPYSLTGIGSGSYGIVVSSVSPTGVRSSRSVAYNTYGGTGAPEILQLPSNSITTQAVRPGESQVRINLPTLIPNQQATYNNFEIRFR